MSKITEKEWVEDFVEFMRAEDLPIPADISRKIRAEVDHDLHPAPAIIFAKFLGVHAVVGTLSLAICDQFGISPFQSGFSLSDYFMKFGHSTCMFLCGVLFIGVSVSAGRWILRPEELKVFRRHAGLEVFGLSMISLGVFAATGAEISFVIGFLWLVGAMLGGMAMAQWPAQTAPVR